MDKLDIIRKFYSWVIEILLLFLLLFYCPLRAQDKLLPVFHFNRLTTADGLPTNEIRSNVIRDKQGFIWIGTVNGLARYDGYKCKIYRNDPSDPTSLSSNSVMALCYDRKQRLWIGTWDTGLSLYDPINDRFVNFLPRRSDDNWLQAKTISVIHEDKNGTIWLGTYSGGIVRIYLHPIISDNNPDSVARHIHFRTILPGGKRNDVMDLENFGDGQITAASLGGLYSIDSLNHVVTVCNNSEKWAMVLDTASAMSLFCENPTKLWIGTYFQGLLLFDRLNNKVTYYHKDVENLEKTKDRLITGIQMDEANRLWLGTNGKLDLFDLKKNEYQDYLNFSNIPASQLWMRLSLDDNGILWIATGADGVFFLTRKSFRFPHYGLQGVEDYPREMETIDNEEDGSYWIGTEGKIVLLDLTLMRINKTVDLFKGEKNTYGGLGAQESYYDKKGTLWYGTWGLGLYKFEPEKEKITNFRYSPQITTLTRSDICRSITEGKDDTLFVACFHDGCMKFSSKSGRFMKVTDISASHVMRDSEGKIWIANERDGLFIYNPTTGNTEHFEQDPYDPKSLSFNRIIKSYQDPQGRIWIGSRNVIELWDSKTRSFQHYTNEEFKDAIYARPLGSDAMGRIWVSYDNALGVLNPATGVFNNFGYSSGLCRPFDMELLKDGRVLLVGSSGMNIVDPLSLFTLLPPPPLVLSRMSINDTVHFSTNKLTVVSTIQLMYNENVVEFEFAAINPGETSLIEYRYRLEGLEDTWINPGERRYVRYPGLNPGNYVFRVKAISRRNEWQPQEITLALTILPPWWRTWWAYTLYGLAIVGLLYRGYRLRLKQIQLKQQAEMEHFQTEHLAEVDRLKSRFFSNISHEFRTPLTLIIGPAEQALDSRDVNTTRQKLHLIKNNAKKLLGLVNQLLDFSRLESGVMKLQASSGDIVKFLRRVVMSFESWAEKKRITLEFKSDLDSIEGFFDSDKLEKIINNLMSNALKFTNEGGEIYVAFRRDVQFLPAGIVQNLPVGNVPTVAIMVRDTGPGISPEHLPHIFDRFYRGDDAHTTNGTGIGLALVKELVQLHHGTITAESEQGKGSVFTVTIPIDKSAYNNEEIAKSLPQRLETEQSEITEPLEKIELEGVKKITDGKPLILLVEDNADLRVYISESLEEDYAIREAGDGEMGYNTAMEIIPDLIISDIMMPEMNGIKLCQMLKKDVRTSHVPIILLTARAGMDSKIEGLEIGADDYITKPFDVRELSARVKNLIEQRRQLRQKFSAGAVLKPGEVAVTSLDDELLKRLMATVEKNISDERFSVENFAREACLSKTHLNRKIHALTNLSPAEFIRYVRLQRARELLEKNAGSVSDIAYQVGFGSPSYFTSCFRERFGYVPSDIHSHNSLTP